MERRTIAELIALHELEPSLRSIYVEGPSDRAFFMSAIRHIGAHEIGVFEVDLVFISSRDCAAFDLGTGAKQRVVVLALLIERQANMDLSHHVICIADADEESGVSKALSGSLLIYTDVTSMPVYCFEPQYIQRYLDVVVLGFPMDGRSLLDRLTPTLRELASFRRALAELGIRCSMVDLSKDCVLNGHDLTFNSENFLRRLAGKANVSNRLDEVRSRSLACGTKLPTDAKHWVHAEDFLFLLHWFITKIRGSSNSVSQHLLARTLLLGIPISDVHSWPLFQQVFARLTHSVVSK